MLTNDKRIEKGHSLRSAVAVLLRSRYGVSSVTEEVIVSGHKAADVLFTPTDLPGMHPRIAVECKNWSSPLNADNIRTIRSDYFDAYAAGNIQALYVIARLNVSASVRATIHDIHWMTFLTFDEFQAGIVDFSGYVDSLVRNFSKDGLNTYYVPSRLENGALLHDEIVVPWLEDEQAKPLAIVAGYGMGKTTYSRFLAHELARTSQKDSSAGIPILLPLGALVHQQSTRSLISYLFADQYRVPGYSYNLFDVLNAAGRFVLIFDAFDEMKFAMSTNDIKHNLEELKSLLTEKTEGILIGRPDPFLSEDQFALLSGREKIIGRLAPTTKLAAFQINRLGYFTNDDVKTFMTKYLAHISEEWKSGKKAARQKLQRRVLQVTKAKYYELARRPVQAKMIAELLITPGFKPEELGIYQLYEHFVAYVMQRETEKLARAKIDPERRLSFLRAVAWWLWTKKAEGHFTYSELPKSRSGKFGFMTRRLRRAV